MHQHSDSFSLQDKLHFLKKKKKLKTVAERKRIKRSDAQLNQEVIQKNSESCGGE